MTTIFTIIFFAILAFDVFMVTPFGMMWALKDHDEGRPMRGVLIVFGTVIPEMIIGCALGLIK